MFCQISRSNKVWHVSSRYKGVNFIFVWHIPPLCTIFCHISRSKFWHFPSRYKGANFNFFFHQDVCETSFYWFEWKKSRVKLLNFPHPPTSFHPPKGMGAPCETTHRPSKFFTYHGFSPPPTLSFFTGYRVWVTDHQNFGGMWFTYQWWMIHGAFAAYVKDDVPCGCPLAGCLPRRGHPRVIGACADW